jgi:hypothetical protein
VEFLRCILPSSQQSCVPSVGEARQDSSRLTPISYCSRAGTHAFPLVEARGGALLEANGERPDRLPRIRIPSIHRLRRLVAYGLKFAGLFSGETLLKTEFPTKLEAAEVKATAYAANLPGGQTSVIILNKDAGADLEVELDLGRGVSGAVETEILHAPALDSREAHIKQGKCSVTISRATGLRLTLT